MEAVEIARKLAALGQTAEARQAYALALRPDAAPAEQLEAAVYMFQTGGDYKVPYTVFLDLYRRGHFREEILPIVRGAFYEPNRRQLRSRYQRNCKALSRYPYLFRKDFIPFEALPIQFFPYDDKNGYVPFDVGKGEFGPFVNIREPVVSRNYFKDLEKPVLASDVYSQYELEYLNDNVRKSEWVARENHLYLHYSGWAEFCSWLQVLNIRPLTEEKKAVFLIGDEIGQYPIDFKERFGIDYSRYPLRPAGIREVTRLIWHTQLSAHNGGDFFNEIFDAHPNLICLPSLMMDSVNDSIRQVRDFLSHASGLRECLARIDDWPPYLVEELYRMRDRTDKDILTAIFLSDKRASCGMDPQSRIAPALFFQPHFYNIVYRLEVDGGKQTVLEAKNYQDIQQSPVFQGFKYIKTFTPMRRFTTSHGATVRFMYESVLNAWKADAENKENLVVSDAISERVLNRSFMIDPEDRLYKDSVLVRFEDGKLNPRATLTALAAFLDLPYTESMTYCSENGVERAGETVKDGYAIGFDPVTVYRTYDDYVNDSERCFIEYFLRDAYQYYGYDFQYYDGKPVDEARALEWIKGFSTIDHYIRETWSMTFRKAAVYKEGERISGEGEAEIQDQLLEEQMKNFHNNRVKNAKVLLEGLHFVNKKGQPLRMMTRLKLDPELLEQPLYH